MRWSLWFLPYLLLLMIVVSVVRADLENVDDLPQPKRGNNALLSRYGRALLSRYGKRSGNTMNPPPIVGDHRLMSDFREGEWLLCQKGINGDLPKCLPYPSFH